MDDRAVVAQIRSEKNEVRKRLLLATFLREKEGLIRDLTRKAAAAEKTTCDIEDLLQAGREGFLRALHDPSGRGKEWDPDKGALSTYVAFWIRKKVQLAAHDAMPIALPRIRLTNDERNRAVLALRDDPDVEPETIGITRAALEQVRHSIGVRYVAFDLASDERADGTGYSGRRNMKLRAMERRINDAVGHVEIEGRIDAARAELEMTRVLRALKRRPRATPEALGVSRDVYAAAVECLALDAPARTSRRIIMVETNGVSGPAVAARKAPPPRTKIAPKAKEPSYEEALRAVVAAKLGMLDVGQLEAIAAQVLTQKAA